MRDQPVGGDPQDYRVRLTAVVDTALSQGVIPVLSTIPDMIIGDGYDINWP